MSYNQSPYVGLTSFRTCGTWILAVAHHMHNFFLWGILGHRELDAAYSRFDKGWFEEEPESDAQFKQLGLQNARLWEPVTGASLSQVRHATGAALSGRKL